MTPDRLAAHFSRIADAPNAIPRLRQFILDLAVRGKLVEQDPKDEPASALIKRIQTEKELLAHEGVIKKREIFEPVKSEEITFTIPRNWAVVRMGWLARKLGAGSTPLGGKEVYLNEGVPFIRSQNVYNDGLRLDGVARIARDVHDRMSGTHIQASDILLNITGASIGRCAVVPSNFTEGNVSQHVAIIRLFSKVPREFIHLSLTSPFFQKLIDDVQVGVSREGLSMQRLRLFPMLLPPTAEQHRIVAKVDELMALCDRLEAAQAERESRRDRLAAASLQRLNQPADAPAFREHACFHLSHLQRLTSRPEQITQLRDTILQLAVLGKLSEQRTTDGDAQDLLSSFSSRNRKSRKSLIDDPQETLAPLPKLPDSWAWSLIDQVAANDENAITDGPFGANLKTSHYIQAPGYRVIRLQNIGRGHFRNENQSYIDKDRFESLAKHRVFAGDLVVAGLVDPFVRCCEVPHDIGPALVKADCYRFKVHPNFLARFAQFYLNSPVCQRFAAVHHHGMTLVRIGLGNFRRLPIPVPPLAEQHRIVAKVDELMALCDRLEAQLTTTQTQSRRLLEAVLHEALAGA